MNNKSQWISINLPNGFQLIAEQNTDPAFQNEIFIGITDENGVWYQDLAIVRQKYNLSENKNTIWCDEEFEVLVYADKYDEDYTNKFDIEIYHGGI